MRSCLLAFLILSLGTAMGQNRSVLFHLGYQGPAFAGDAGFLVPAFPAGSSWQLPYRKVSAGSGNIAGIRFCSDNDSSILFLQGGADLLWATLQEIAGRRDTGSVLDQSIAFRNSQVRIAVEAGIRSGYFRVGLGAVAARSMAGRLFVHSADSNGFADWSAQVVTPLSIGFTGFLRWERPLSSGVRMFAEGRICVMQLRPGKVLIDRYRDSKGRELQQVFASQSSRETEFVKVVNAGINDPVLNPKGFDPDKALQTQSARLSGSSMGLQMGLIFPLN